MTEKIKSTSNVDTLGVEEIIFDAERDNGGRGISPAEMIKALKKIRNG